MQPIDLNGREELASPSGDEMAALLKQAETEGKKVLPVGGATRMAYGNPPQHVDWMLSTKQLNKILAYEPHDLTVSVEAGVPLAEIQSLLAKNGQSIPIETWSEDRATIGGIMASALYGPRRFGNGTLRDYLIGVSAAYPDGTHAKAGGMVVKNVSGFDLMRMLHGSLGTLGVITSINLKVLPKARAEMTTFGTLPNLDAARETMNALLHLPMRPISLEMESADEQWEVLARFEGRPQSMARIEATIAKSFPAAVETVHDSESESFWRDYVAKFTAAGFEPYLWLRIRSLPSTAFADLEKLESLFSTSELGHRVIRCSPGLGTIDCKLDLKGLDHQQMVDRIDSIRRVFSDALLMTAPETVKQAIDTFADKLESQEFMQRLKDEFDPGDILNPGRLLPAKANIQLGRY